MKTRRWPPATSFRVRHRFRVDDTDQLYVVELLTGDLVREIVLWIVPIDCDNGDTFIEVTDPVRLVGAIALASTAP